MNDIWVLSVRTSLPGTCAHIGNFEPKFLAFESFQKAREACRAKIKDLAFSENSMFDGKGKITHLSEYADEFDEEYEDEPDDSDWLGKNRITQIHEALTAIFSGIDTKLNIENGDYDDCMIAVHVENNSVNFYGIGDGPLNECDPVLKTNMFSMEKESDYYLYIDDFLGQHVTTAELYIDLKKVTPE